MSLFVYAPKLYPGTRELLDALQAKRLVKHDGMRFLHKGVPIEFGPQDTIVCWGAHIPAVGKIPCLNSSYTYASIQDLVTRGITTLRHAGYTAMIPRAISNKQYADALAATDPNTWWPTKPTQFVGLPDVEGYGIDYHGFKNVTKQHVFKSEDNSFASKILTSLKLDFATLYVGKHHGDDYLLRITTAPTLNTAEVKLYAEQITKWIKGNNITVEMKELLE